MSQATKDKTIWGIHAGKTGDATTLFLKHSCVALGWDQMADLSQLAPNRKAFKAAVAKTYPKKKPGAIPNNAGQLFRFLHEMKIGDLVVFPNKSTRKLHLGRIVGDYEYLLNLSQGYPNIRKVEWLLELDRKTFSQGALYEIGSAMSLFQVKNHADEFRAALEGKAVAPVVSEDDTVSAVAENIEENTRDFVLKSLSRELKGLPLEDFIRHLLECMSYQARLTKKNEPSVDVIATRINSASSHPSSKCRSKAAMARPAIRTSPLFTVNSPQANTASSSRSAASRPTHTASNKAKATYASSTAKSSSTSSSRITNDSTSATKDCYHYAVFTFPNRLMTRKDNRLCAGATNKRRRSYP